LCQQRGYDKTHGGMEEESLLTIGVVHGTHTSEGMYRKQRNFVHNGALYLFQKFIYICHRTRQIKVRLKP
jgi:hypothetical protein